MGKRSKKDKKDKKAEGAADAAFDAGCSFFPNQVHREGFLLNVLKTRQ